MSAEPETQKLLERIDRMLVQKPFVPFRVRTSNTEFEIRAPDQGRFNHRGTFEVRRDGMITYCFIITLVEPL